MPTTLLKAPSTSDASSGSTSSTSASTVDSRTIGVIPPIREPEMATPRAQATSSTATALRAAPPMASTARMGCHLIRARIRAPTYCSTACPRDAHRMTMKSAPSETHRDGSASPSAIGASQTPKSPPHSSPAVAKAPVTKPCQYPDRA